MPKRKQNDSFHVKLQKQLLQTNFHLTTDAENQSRFSQNHNIWIFEISYNKCKRATFTFICCRVMQHIQIHSIFNAKLWFQDAKFDVLAKRFQRERLQFYSLLEKLLFSFSVSNDCNVCMCVFVCAFGQVNCHPDTNATNLWSMDHVYPTPYHIFICKLQIQMTECRLFSCV